MKLFEERKIDTKISYVFETTDTEDGLSLWAARLGIIANLPNAIEEGHFKQPDTDTEDDMIIASAGMVMGLIHVFGNAGHRFLFTGLLYGTHTELGVRFYDAERMTEIHVWPGRIPVLISIFHSNTNINYQVRVHPDFR